MRFLLLSLLALVLTPALMAADGETSTTATAPTNRPWTLSPSFAFELGYAPAQIPNYDWGNGAKTDATGMGFTMGFDWMPAGWHVGKLGLGTHLTLLHFPKVVDTGSMRSTLTAVPVDVSVSYRFEYLPRQVLVPMVRAGAEYIWIDQSRLDREGHYGGWIYGLGAELCLSALDRASARSLYSNMGITGTYIVGEYFRSEAIESNPGVSFKRSQYRVTMRFEF